MGLPFDFDAFAEAIGLQRSKNSNELSYGYECVVITSGGGNLLFTEWGYSPELALDTVIERGGEILVWPTSGSPSYAVSQKMLWPRTFNEAFAIFVACDWCDLQEREEIEHTYWLLAGRRFGFDLPMPARPRLMVRKGSTEGRISRTRPLWPSGRASRADALDSPATRERRHGPRPSGRDEHLPGV
jgi:hypothetical protein